MSPRAWRIAAYGVPLAFLALFFAYPLTTILTRGLRTGGGGSALDVLTGQLFRDVAWFTVWQAAISTAITLAVALPAAWAVGRFAFRGRRLVLGLLVIPFVLPSVVVALAFTSVLPDRVEHTPLAIVVANAFFNVAVVVRIVGTFWAQLDPRATEAAATLGAGPWGRFRLVTVPLLGPALAAATSIVFLFSLTSFGVVLILGGPRWSTLETEIYNQAVRAYDLRAAAILSLVQLTAVGAVVAVTTWLEGRLAARGGLVPEDQVLRRPSSTRERMGLAAALGLLGVYLLAPIVVLVRRSLTVGDGLGFDAYRQLAQPTSTLLVEPWQAIGNSLAFASAATIIALVVGGLAAFAVAERGRGGAMKRSLDGVLMLPLGVSAVMLGFGFVIAFDESPLDFRAKIWIVPVVQALVAIPFVVRIVAPTLRGIDPRAREAAAMLGASPARVRREIDLPVAGRALAVAAGFAFAIALGEFGATVFLARPDHPTLPVAIFRFLQRPGEINTAQAYGLAVVLMVVTAVSVLLVERVRVRRTTF